MINIVRTKKTNSTGSDLQLNNLILSYSFIAETSIMQNKVTGTFNKEQIDCLKKNGYKLETLKALSKDENSLIKAINCLIENKLLTSKEIALTCQQFASAKKTREAATMYLSKLV
jgi:hypothetical protein